MNKKRSLHYLLYGCMAMVLVSCELFENTKQTTDVENRALLPIILNGKWGFININGAISIVPRFDEALAPQKNSNLAAVRIGSLWGFVDAETADLLIEPSYAQVGIFTEEGIASFRNDAGKWGFINQSGTVIIEPTYDFVKNFSDGLAAVRVQSQWGYIDVNGEIVIPLTLNTANNFSEDLASIEDAEGWAIIDKDGSTVIRPRFTVQYLGDFKDGLAPVQTNEGWGYLNAEGALEIPIMFEEAFSFSENRARVMLDNYFGFIDTTGEIVIPTQFEDAYDFNEDFAAVQIGNSWYFIKQSNGSLLLTPSFAEVKSFNNGLSMVSIGNENDRRIGYINKEGEYVWFPAN